MILKKICKHRWGVEVIIVDVNLIFSRDLLKLLMDNIRILMFMLGNMQHAWFRKHGFWFKYSYHLDLAEHWEEGWWSIDNFNFWNVLSHFERTGYRGLYQSSVIRLREAFERYCSNHIGQPVVIFYLSVLLEYTLGSVDFF